MFRALTVVPSRTSAAREPVPDLVIRVNEHGGLTFSVPLVAGRRVIRVENQGAKDYEFQVRRVRPGHTIAEALAWRRRAGLVTPPPFDAIGGLSDVPGKGAVTTTMTFAVGDYFVGAATRVPFTVLPTSP